MTDTIEDLEICKHCGFWKYRDERHDCKSRDETLGWEEEL